MPDKELDLSHDLDFTHAQQRVRVRDHKASENSALGSKAKAIKIPPESTWALPTFWEFLLSDPEPKLWFLGFVRDPVQRPEFDFEQGFYEAKNRETFAGVSQKLP